MEECKAVDHASQLAQGIQTIWRVWTNALKVREGVQIRGSVTNDRGVLKHAEYSGEVDCDKTADALTFMCCSTTASPPSTEFADRLSITLDKMWKNACQRSICSVDYLPAPEIGTWTPPSSSIVTLLSPSCLRSKIDPVGEHLED